VTDHRAVMGAFSLEAFRPHLGTTFRVALGLQSIALTLQAVQAGRETHSFALAFRGPLAPVLPQATYRFTHEALGAFDLFIVPRGRTPAALDYEAIVNPRGG
jgi:hypothetical protein